MDWFNILKVLGTKTGFSQLDFDNIVIEDDDDCKKRWQQLCQELEGFTIPDTGEYRTRKTKQDGMRRVYFMKDEVRIGKLYLHYDYSSEIPEEIYCKALEVLSDTSLIDINSVKIKEYEITKVSGVSERTGHKINIRFDYYVEIRTPQMKYSDIGFTLEGSDNSLKPIIRKLLEILK